MKIFERAIFAFFFLAVALSISAQDETRSATTWQVEKYDLTATLPVGERDRSLAVRATISLKNVSGKPASTLTLRMGTTSTVSAIKINDSVVEFVKSEEKINANTNLQRNVVRIPSAAPAGIISAVVDYKIDLKDNSSLNAISPAASQFLPLSFWYPTPNSWFFGRGADSAPVRIKVNTPGGQSAISSGVETSGAFDQKISVQPFFTTGNWDVTNLTGVSVYAPKGAGAGAQKVGAELAGIVKDARAFAVGYLGAEPETTLRVVAVKRGGGFSSAGTMLVDEAVFRRSKVDSLTAVNLAEAAVRTWIGGSIAANGDGYGVIREGLTRFIATEFIESKFGKDVADVERLRQRNAYAAISKRDAPMSKVSPLDDFYFQEVANKGAMAWRLLAKKLGKAEFSGILKANMLDGDLNVVELRAAFSADKEMIDHLFDQVTDTNLLVGLPQISGGETKIALRNTGSIDATVNVRATMQSGPPMDASTTIRATSYGDVTFKTTNKIIRVEVDIDKLYPQTEYSDDIAPRESTDSDPLLAVKRAFDKQDFVASEALAKTVLRDLPRFDEVRILLGRSQLALGKTAEADKEFQAVLDEKLPTVRSIGWANEGRAEVAAKANQTAEAAKFIEAAIVADSDFGASLAARNLRNKAGISTTVDAVIKTLFTDFDRVAASNRKTDIDAMFLAGEAVKFSSGISGSVEEWQTQVKYVDRIDADTVLVEANVNIKLLTKNAESGMAVYRLNRVAGGWKIAAVEMFEVR